MGLGRPYRSRLGEVALDWLHRDGTVLAGGGVCNAWPGCVVPCFDGGKSRRLD